MSTMAAYVERPAANKTLLFSSFAVCVFLSFTVCSFTAVPWTKLRAKERTEREGTVDPWMEREGIERRGARRKTVKGRGGAPDRNDAKGASVRDWVTRRRRRGKRLVGRRGRGPAAGRRRFRGTSSGSRATQ